LLVRSWNVFHGNSMPPGRRSYLERAVRLAAADAPDVLCLQELPVWSLAHVGEWSGMHAVTAVAARPTLGPLPSTAEVGRALTALHPGLLRSAFSGQGNAILVARGLQVRNDEVLVLNSLGFRRQRAHALSLPLVTRLAWAKERRVCQGVRVLREDGCSVFVSNLHVTSYEPDRRLAEAELLRAATFTHALAGSHEPCVLAGDLNLRPPRLAGLRDFGFAGPGPGIDHVLVRGDATPTTVWPEERRRIDGVLVSDHAPVEATIA
jgi:endonuclease/exonuclease/phosphatase family metal-dependent hydrolase